MRSISRQQNEYTEGKVEKKKSNRTFIRRDFYAITLFRSRIVHQFTINLKFAQFDFPHSINSNQTIPHRLIELEAVEKVYSHSQTDI